MSKLFSNNFELKNFVQKNVFIYVVTRDQAYRRYNSF